MDWIELKMERTVEIGGNPSDRMTREKGRELVVLLSIEEGLSQLAFATGCRHSDVGVSVFIAVCCLKGRVGVITTNSVQTPAKTTTGTVKNWKWFLIFFKKDFLF